MPSVVPFTWCLIFVFTAFIGEGNGKWKSKNRENLHKDIAKFQEMAGKKKSEEKIEDEIEDIYGEYSDNWTNNEYFTNEEDAPKSRNVYNTKNINSKISNSTNNITEGDVTPTPGGGFTENVTSKIDNMKEIGSPEKINIVNSRWPKFEDILLDMGKKYDWKNDRWIKVKKKINQSSKDKYLNFLERHKFSYKTVKLNRSKSRRNVVIAVTAVR